MGARVTGDSCAATGRAQRQVGTLCGPIVWPSLLDQREAEPAVAAPASEKREGMVVTAFAQRRKRKVETVVAQKQRRKVAPNQRAKGIAARATSLAFTIRATLFQISSPWECLPGMQQDWDRVPKGWRKSWHAGAQAAGHSWPTPRVRRLTATSSSSLLKSMTRGAGIL